MARLVGALTPGRENPRALGDEDILERMEEFLSEGETILELWRGGDAKQERKYDGWSERMTRFADAYLSEEHQALFRKMPFSLEPRSRTAEEIVADKRQYLKLRRLFDLVEFLTQIVDELRNPKRDRHSATGGDARDTQARPPAAQAEASGDPAGAEGS